MDAGYVILACFVSFCFGMLIMGIAWCLDNRDTLRKARGTYRYNFTEYDPKE